MARSQGKSSEVKESEPAELTPAQEAVIAALLDGKTQAEAAALAGVVPETISRWKSKDALFVATWQTRRRQVWESHAQRLRNLAGKALDVVEKGLDAGDMRAAGLVLKSVNLAELTIPAPETTPGEVAQDWKREEWTSVLLNLAIP